MKNYVFGDTGGHMKPLYASLHALGIDTFNGTIPEGIRIIHLGDLIHKGPHSSVLLEQVDRLIRNNPGQWIQMLGNHEFQHIQGSPYFWQCSCNFADITIINDWHEEGLAFATYGIDSYKVDSIVLEQSARKAIPRPDTGIFFSHAGLSKPWWDTFGRIKSPSQLSKVLNKQPVKTITLPGQMLNVFNTLPGPVWAIGNSEVFDTWHEGDSVDMPFIQMHGHTTSYQWATNRWWRNDKAFRAFRDNTKLNPKSRAVITKTANNLLIGLDPGYAATANTKEQPYLYFES
jgi:hypothetical protein